MTARLRLPPPPKHLSAASKRFWKAIVTEREEPALTSADEAAKLFLHEDGFQTGLLYREQRTSWPPERDRAADENALAGLAASFRV